MSKFEYKVIAIRSMYDGDSVKITALREHAVPGQIIDFGFGDVIDIPAYTIKKEIDVDCRMAGYDTPELRDKRPLWKEAAYLARDIARDWMETKMEHGGLTMVSVKTSKDQEAKGKFGRYLCNFKDVAGHTLMDHLIDRHMAVPYHGQNKSDVEAQHAANILALSDAGHIGK